MKTVASSVRMTTIASRGNMNYRHMLIAAAIFVLTACARSSAPVDQNQAHTPVTQSAVESTPVPSSSAPARESRSVESTPTAGEQDAPFKIVYDVEMEGVTVSGETYFFDQYVVEVLDLDAGEFGAVFNLDRKAWTDSETKEQVKLSACEAWVQASEDKSRKSLSTITDANTKRLTEGLIDPKYEITVEADGTLKLDSGIYRYEITPSAPQSTSLLNRYFDYEHMSACMKALLQRKFTPTGQWRMLDELRSRGVFPARIRFEFNLGKTQITSTLTAAIKTPTEAELALVRAASEQ
jgi:hypothetical protein